MATRGAAYTELSPSSQFCCSSGVSTNVRPAVPRLPVSEKLMERPGPPSSRASPAVSALGGRGGKDRRRGAPGEGDVGTLRAPGEGDVATLRAPGGEGVGPKGLPPRPVVAPGAFGPGARGGVLPFSRPKGLNDCAEPRDACAGAALWAGADPAADGPAPFAGTAPGASSSSLESSKAGNASGASPP